MITKEFLNRRLQILVVCSLFLLGKSQAAEQFAYAISFTHKPVNIVELSQRSLDRRARLGIATDSTDYVIAPSFISNVLNTVGSDAILHHRSKWLNHVVVLMDDTLQLSAIRQLSFVKDVQWVGYYSAGLHQQSYQEVNTLPGGAALNWQMSKPVFNSAFYNFSWQQTHIVHGESLHELGYLGDDVLIALMDEGYAGLSTISGFDSLTQYSRIRDAYDFVKNDFNVEHTSQHGTWSLSNISGYEPQMYCGAAPKASIALYITEDRLSEQYMEMYNLLAASERADSIGADIINVSLGYNEFFGPAQMSLTHADIDGKSTIAARAANMATQKGIVFVASAGNEGGNGWNKILTPGDADSAITVGNVSNDRTPAASSGFGPNASGIIKPNVATQGQPAFVYTTSGIIGLNGTSESTPQIAGWIACLLDARSQLKPFELKSLLEQSAHLYPSNHPQMGYGVPDFSKIIQILQLESIWPTPPNVNSGLKILGNPIKGSLSWQWNSNKSGSLRMRIVDMNGKEVFKASYPVLAGTNSWNTFLDLPAGIYQMQVQEDELTEVKRFAILP